MTNKRESYPHYIGVTPSEETQMLQKLGLQNAEDLFSHIPKDNMHTGMEMEDGLNHDVLKKRISKIAGKNNLRTSFVGDGLQDFKVSKVAPSISAIRGLTTAYTPYQPERSQGTLQTLWIYQSVISKITGFEAINASLYERSTCIYEALACASRIKKGASSLLIADTIFPGDKEVIETQARHTGFEIIYAPMDTKTGLIDKSKLKKILKSNDDIAGFAFNQINTLGLIEDVDELTDITHENNLLAIAIVEIAALSNNGLKEPASWGSRGADLLVAEAQHLTIAPNFGGPGLGVFGVRFNDQNKLMIRQTAGRFIGLAKDSAGRECKSIILSTREQHIRRDKAYSNICSNQSFIASLCGATILNRGASGFEKSFTHAHTSALKLIRELTTLEGVNLIYSGSIFNEFVLRVKTPISELTELAFEEDLHIGVDISGRCGLSGNILKISLSDKHTSHDLQKLINFFKRHFKQGSISDSINTISAESKRANHFELKSFSEGVLEEYYTKLGNQNLSPDQGIYPLGSCTMKYNPELNEWAAALPKFAESHPQAPLEDVQGNLQILFEIQELFKDITGLPGLTTQPVAGAQGELVGLKMFQAYHANNGEADTRNIILIPRTAHGTNPATATMAGYVTKKIDGKKVGIVTIEANSEGEMDFDQLTSLVNEHGKNIAGIMVTNPNTAGIFETRFGEMSKLIHDVGGLVYMDGANMNAIAGWVDLDKLGVDAVHNNLHKTWSIPHGGGGPGDAIVAVSEKLIDFLPGVQIQKEGEKYSIFKPKNSIGSIHRHFGNFGHKVRAYTYLKALGKDGIKRMAAIATLSARYLYNDLKDIYPILPVGSENNPRMHEFILTLSDDTFKRIAEAGTPKAKAIARVGKLFLDFGFHAPTVAFPEVYGLMLEPTESYTKDELDGFCDVVKTIHNVVNEYPHILQTVPHFTPIDRVDEVLANKVPILSEDIVDSLSPILPDRIENSKLRNLSKDVLIKEIVKAHEEQQDLK